jgi:hypothetical protein
MKRNIIIFFCVITVIAATSILVFSLNSKEEFIEYKTDIEPLVSRFPNIGEIKKGYWTSVRLLIG